MDYEPEQDLLIIQCGLPEMGLLLVDWPAKQVLRTNLELPIDEDFVKLRFNPLRNDQLIMVKKNSLDKLTLEKKDFLRRKGEFDKVTGNLTPGLRPQEFPRHPSQHLEPVSGRGREPGGRLYQSPGSGVHFDFERKSARSQSGLSPANRRVLHQVPLRQSAADQEIPHRRPEVAAPMS